MEEGGWHAAEGLVPARYMMFTQVYFQHTRRAYDYHLAETVRQLLKDSQPCTCPHRGKFPPPTSIENIEEFIQWNDWLVTGLVQTENGGEHGRILRERMHHRCVYQTGELPSVDEIAGLEDASSKLGSMVGFIDEAEKSWYKFGKEDVNILPEKNKQKSQKSVLLSNLSSVVRGLNAVRQKRIYVSVERKREAEEILGGL